MKAQESIESQQASELASLLIPLQGSLLLVPNVSLAEIVPPGRIDTVAGSPDWYLGDYQWRDLSIPLLSFECLQAGVQPRQSDRARVAIFNTTGVTDQINFFSLMTQGLPRLARVTPDELQVRDGERRSYEQMRVNWAGEAAVIPDLPALEEVVLNYLKTRL